MIHCAPGDHYPCMLHLRRPLSAFIRFASFPLALLLCTGAGAGTLAPELQEILASSSSGDEIPVIVRFRGGVEPGAVTQGTRRERRGRLVQLLRATADLQQDGVRRWLRLGSARRTRQLWAINALATTLPAHRIRRLAGRPGVESVSPDATVLPPPTTQASPAPAEWNIEDIRAPELWDLGFTGAGRVVALLDTGVDLDHPDLGGRWRGGSGGWFDPHGEHATPHDADGHGTAALGLMIGGDAGGSSIGVAPGAQWIAAKIFADSGGGTLSGIHQAFQWVLDPHGDGSGAGAPDVVNASWTLLGTVDLCNTEFESDIALLRAADIAVVVSAGNFGPGSATSVSPANNDGSIPVGAVSSSGNVASFSSRGPSACDGGIYPQVSAPGVDVTTSALTFGGAFPDSYTGFSGTSASAPHVTGAIALLKSAVGDVTPDAMEAALRSGAADLGPNGPDDAYGWGLLDVYASYLDLADSGAPPPPPPPPPPPGETLEATFEPDADARVSSGSPNANYGSDDVLKIEEDSTVHHAYLKFEVAGLQTPIESAVLRLYVTNSSSDGAGVWAVSGDHPGGGPWSETGITWNNAPPIAGSPLDSRGSVKKNGWVELDVTAAVSANGSVSLGLMNFGTDSARFSSKEGGHPPELVVVSASGPPTADFGGAPLTGTAPLTVAFSDASAGEPTSWSWDFGDGASSSARNPSHTYTVPGVYDVSLVATNGSGSDEKSVAAYVEVSEPLPPVADFLGAPVSGTAPLQVDFDDLSSGNPTSWSWDFGDGGVSSSQHPSHTYTLPGSYDVSLTVSNGNGSDQKSLAAYIAVSAPPPPPPVPSVQVLAPSHDARVKSTEPDANFGLDDLLKAEQDSNVYHSYLRFDVGALAGDVLRATLRLWVANGSSDGVAVTRVANEYAGTATPWSEAGITWNNAPAISAAPLDSLADVPKETWIELDVTAAVAGPGAVSFGLWNDGTDSARFDSKEGARPPELVIESQ